MQGPVLDGRRVQELAGLREGTDAHGGTGRGSNLSRAARGTRSGGPGQAAANGRMISPARSVAVARLLLRTRAPVRKGMAKPWADALTAG